MASATTVGCAGRDISALDFGALVRAGDRVLVGQAGAEPLSLTQQLVAQKDRIGSFEIFVGALYSETFAPERTAGIRFSSYGAIGRAASLSRAGMLEIFRYRYSALADAFACGALRADVVLLQLAAPLAGRRASFALANDYVAAAARHARVVVAEINPHTPWTFGAELPDDFPLHVCVDASVPPLDVSPSPLTTTEQRIADYVAGLVPNGAVLQFGVGALPDAILAGLTQHRDLGIHSGIMGDRVVDLIEQGAITNAAKPFDRGVSVANIMLGTQRLRAFVHDNPAVRVAPANYTHGLPVLRRLDHFVAINSAVEVDLTGQVNSEVAKGVDVGGLGGLNDFVEGANAARAGRSIIALPACTKKGQSRIVADVAKVSVEREAADVVVTECGIAELRGCDNAERGRRMIGIAAPEFRETLARAHMERSKNRHG
jgi:acyl-CoA hydrolase